MKNFTEDVLVRMMDERTSETARNLYGHGGPIYSLSFSPDRNLLLSSSEDSTSKTYIMQYTALYYLMLIHLTYMYLSNPIKYILTIVILVYVKNIFLILSNIKRKCNKS